MEEEAQNLTRCPCWGRSYMLITPTLEAEFSGYHILPNCKLGHGVTRSLKGSGL